MGKDKYENEDLIKYGLPTDLWFHVDGLSSAHVYLRLPNLTDYNIDTIPEDVLEECLQLTKNNSIEGCKLKSTKICYTPWSNLEKTSNMETGAIGHKDKKLMRYIHIEKDREICKRMNKTCVEKQVDFEQEQLNYEKELIKLRKIQYAENMKIKEEEEIVKKESYYNKRFDYIDELSSNIRTNKNNLDDDDFM